MGDSENPKLINRESGAVIEVNSNPFSIGRGLSCAYVLQSKVVSRVHCVLEKDENNCWILKDTSTNGTYVNGKLIKGVKSPPLNNNATINLDLNDDSYVFQLTATNHMEDISDEQLCYLADSVLDEVAVFQQSSQNQNNNALLANVAMDVDDAPIVPTSTSHSVNHLGTAKPAESHVNKKRKTGVATSVAAITKSVDLTQDSTTSSTAPEQQAGDRPGPSVSVDKSPDGTSANSKSCESPPQARKAANEPQQDNFEVMENELQCAICSELFVKAVTLNCTHTFCKCCIELWKKNKSECPICRTRITGMTSTLVLDNVIEKVIEGSSEEVRERRKQLLAERQKLEQPKPPPRNQRTRGRGRGRGRTRGGRGADTPGGRVNYSTTISIGRAGDPVIEIGSDSDIDLNSDVDLNSDIDLDSDSDSDVTSDWRDEYDDDEWYGDGVPGAYYGGYGHCFSCGRRGHWSNGCPYR